MAVVSAYTSLSETDDEPFHIACGMQWWKEGKYTMQPLHPPLARVMDAVLVFANERLFGPLPHKGPQARSGYMTHMVLSRLGTLPFYLLACGVVFAWGRRIYGEEAALWGLACFVTLSSVTGHAMLATTDMAYTALFLWALYAFVLWLDAPSVRHSLWLGAALGLMVGAKFSGLLHWPMAVLAMLGVQLVSQYFGGLKLWLFTRRHVLGGLAFVLPLCAGVLWVLYLGDLGKLAQGVRDALALNERGFGIWFYGPLKEGSDWLFFPVVFFFKTPLSFLLSASVGAGITVRQALAGRMRAEAVFPLVAALAVMASSMASHINLGVRHVLPVYPLLCMAAGYALWRLWWAGIAWRLVAVAVVFAQVVSFCMGHPEHLAYFNALAGKNPERITLDSDFDWGQGMILLDEETQRRGITSLYLCARKDAVWSAGHVVKAKTLPCPRGPVTGWVALSRAWRLQHAQQFAWLPAAEAVEPIGKTLDIYYIAPTRPENGVQPIRIAPPPGKGKPMPNPAAALPKELKPLLPKPAMSHLPKRKPSLTPAARP
ncbi:MAG: glycosyltransferase family 39 protein, partial [Rickettsiales bacterium]|nr:glycosyltransferase family 39 protein [Rickettsiales bacterium]